MRAKALCGRSVNLGAACAAALLLTTASCSATPSSTTVAASSTQANASGRLAIRPRQEQEPRPVVIVERPSGKLEMFPDGPVVSQQELASGKLAPFDGVREEDAPPDPQGPPLDPGHPKRILRLPHDHTVALRGAYIYDPTSWLVMYDDKEARVLKLDSGEWMPATGPALRRYYPSFKAVIGDYVAEDALWHLPDFVLVAKPSAAPSGDLRLAVSWGVAAGTAVALEAVQWSNGLTLWALESWDLKAPSKSHVIELPNLYEADMALSPDGKTVLLGERELGLVDLASGKRTPLLDEVQYASVRRGRLAFSGDGSKVCALGDHEARVVNLGPVDSPKDTIRLPIEGDDCDDVAVPLPPPGRVLYGYAEDNTYFHKLGAARSPKGDLAVVDETPGSWPVEFHVRVFHADRSVAADLAFVGSQFCAPRPRFEDESLIVRDAKTCGGRVDLRTMDWRQKFGASEPEEARESRVSTSIQQMLDALGPPPNGGPWFSPPCKQGDPCSRPPSGGTWAAVAFERTGAQDAETDSFIVDRRGPGGDAALADATIYDGWFVVNRRSDGKLLATVVRIGTGAVALLSGGAVETFGAAPDNALFCRSHDTLRPWADCKDRFTVVGGLAAALRGEETYLE